MRYIPTFESFLNEENKYQSLGKLYYNDQLADKKITLGRSLAKDSGLDVDFDHIALYDVKSGGTIVPDALSGKYDYDELLDIIDKWKKAGK